MLRAPSSLKTELWCSTMAAGSGPTCQCYVTFFLSVAWLLVSFTRWSLVKHDARKVHLGLLTVRSVHF
jgi:hypothetical protein